MIYSGSIFRASKGNKIHFAKVGGILRNRRWRISEVLDLRYYLENKVHTVNTFFVVKLIFICKRMVIFT